jgi:glycosyltransferase involved in cell wall biosynthesis
MYREESIRQELIFAVPTLNRYEALINLLNSVETGTIKAAAYCIIDNGGKLKDEISKNEWKLPARSEIIEPNGNIGVAASWNLALGKGARYTVLAGDDCIFEPDALEKLLDAADETDGPGLFSPKLNDGSSEWACFLQNKALTDIVGLYDERFYPGYFEDDDYRHRMSLFGIAPIHVPSAVVNHIGGATTSQFDQSTLWINADRYEEKWGGPKGAEKVMTAPPIVERIRKISNARPNIVVYTITKNEEKFIVRYCEAAKDADEIVIVDTGSTDATVDTAEKCGATVHRINVFPWRFDTARSASLALLRPDVDICVAADADEVLEDGWREEIERVWSDGTTKLRYLYDWGSGVRFMIDKIHARHGYVWKHPCHEILVRDGRSPEKIAFTEKLIIRHLPDPGKTRGHYLELLKLGVEEDPNCSRNAFYYARELTFRRIHSEAIAELKRYLALPTAIWDAERVYAMHLLGNAYEAMNEANEAFYWFSKAAEEAPGRRESWFALAEASYRRGAWDECYAAAVRCLSIPKSTDWLTEIRANGASPYDYAAISAWWIGKNSEAIEYGEKALNLEPENQRLAKNLEWYIKMMSNAKAKRLEGFVKKVTDAQRST